MSRPQLHDLVTGNDSGGSLSSSLALSPVSRPIFRASPKSPIPSFLHSRLPSKDKGDLPIKTRLVEQFYKTDQSQRPAASAFRSGDISTIPINTNTTRTPPQSNFDDAVRKGQLAFQPLDAEINAPTEILDSLMHFNAVYTDKSDLHLEVVEHAIDLVSRVGKELHRVLAAKEIDFDSMASHQLARLREYLQELQFSISKVHHDLSSTTTQLKAQYKDEMKASMDKLEHLELTLKMLGSRLDRARLSINSSKTLLQETMAEKLRVLEFILAKFTEYDQLNRQRRVRQLIVALVVAVAVVVVYSIWTHR